MDGRQPLRQPDVDQLPSAGEGGSFLPGRLICAPSFPPHGFWTHLLADWTLLYGRNFMAQREIAPSSVEGNRRGKPSFLALWITCGRRRGDLRREPHERFPRVQIGIVQYAIEQRGEDLTHTPAGD